MADPKLIIGVLGVTLVLVGGLAWWSGVMNAPASLDTIIEEPLPAPLTAEELDIMQQEISNPDNPTVTLETNLGAITLELFADVMPITAGNFATLVADGFYDGIKFHRVIDGFMIQGGDPITKTDDVARYGTGGPGYAIADEHITAPHLTNVRGTIAMANSGPNSGGSQFFINLEDNVALDFDKQPLSSKHPVFGRVIEGMEVVDAIAAVETNERDLPIEEVIINKATITGFAAEDVTEE